MTNDHDPLNPKSSMSASNALSDTLRWAFELETKPSEATANWIAAEIVPTSTSAIEAILCPTTTLAQLCDLKSAFKSMRVSGATVGERRLAARLYAGSIAAAVVRYHARASTQSNPALIEAFSALAADTDLPERMREIAELALTGLSSLPPWSPPKKS